MKKKQQQSARRQPERQQQPRRSFLVLSSLVAVLTLTSVLLRAMQGAPLTPDAASSLMDGGGGDPRTSLSAIFNTAVPAHPTHWRSIFIHHSRTAGGDAGTLGRGQQGSGDHFVIGNGDGAVDGQIQLTPRWNLQQASDPTPGYVNVKDDCVSICLVGDFDQTTPSPTQLKQLKHLVHTLQEHFRIPATQVWVFDRPASPAGVGRYFPAGAFQGQLLR